MTAKAGRTILIPVDDTDVRLGGLPIVNITIS